MINPCVRPWLRFFGAAIGAGDVVVNARHGFRQVQNFLKELVDLFFRGSLFELEQDNMFNLRHGVRVVFFALPLKLYILAGRARGASRLFRACPLARLGGGKTIIENAARRKEDFRQISEESSR